MYACPFSCITTIIQFMKTLCKNPHLGDFTSQLIQAQLLGQGYSQKGRKQ